MNHEARATSYGNGVLTVQQSAASIPAAARSFNGAVSSLYLDDAIAYLDRTTGELTSLVSLSSYFDPVTTHVSAPNSYTTEKTLMCSDSVAAPWTDVHNVSDWSHMSSVSEGTDVYVVALRNLVAVLAFYKAGAGEGLRG